uniref:Uncharacterized protein n=1 Tax=viral metagenome TaxID=1070528 RepID=A0A6C0KF84_9ZZZZ
MTSAVPGYTVAEVRRCLASTRSVWGLACESEPFMVSGTNEHKISFGRFSYLFLLGHHQKRQKRS